MNDNIYKAIAKHVTELFEQHANSNLQYHNIDHTKKVVQRAEEIGAHYKLSEEDTLTLYTAAWFHDVGHLFTEMDKHEEKSAELMGEFMHAEGVSDVTIDKIADCIKATRSPADPHGLVQEIICDADTYHFGTGEFKETNKLVKKEFKLRGYNTLTQDWNSNTVELLKKHIYFTTYCKILLNEKKEKNIQWLEHKIHNKKVDNVHHDMFSRQNNLDEKQSKNLLSRGLQTAMRVTSSNHLHLSEMADRKANILISVNYILIGVLISVLVDKLPDFPYLTVPAIIFIGSSMATIIIAIMATRPKITEGVFSREDILGKKTNLLFFGNFYRSSLEEYQWAMSVMMNDTEYMYSALIKDIHQIGVVLGKKYKLIRLAYTIFMISLIVSVLAFFIAVLLNIYTSGKNPTVISTSTGSPL